MWAVLMNPGAGHSGSGEAEGNGMSVSTESWCQLLTLGRGQRGSKARAETEATGHDIGTRIIAQARLTKAEAETLMQSSNEAASHELSSNAKAILCAI